MWNNFLLRRSISVLTALALFVFMVQAQPLSKEFPAGTHKSLKAGAHMTSTTKGRLPGQKIREPRKSGMLKQTGIETLVPPTKSKTAEAAGAYSDMPVLYGSCLYSNTWAESNPQVGLYNIPTAAGTESQKLFSGPKAQYGGVCHNGYYYATTQVTVLGMFLHNEVTVYDVTTGQQVGTPMQFEDMDVLALGLAVHPWGDVWGISYNKDATAYQISWLEYSPSNVEVTSFGTVDAENVHAFAIDSKGNAYAIISDIELVNGVTTVANSRLVKVDLYSGALTEIGPTGVNSIYTTGACIDPKTDRMFWTVCPEDETGNLYEVDIATGAATKLLEFDDAAEYAGIYVAASASDEGAPGPCGNVYYNFIDDSLAGTVSLTAPSVLADGETAGSGELNIKVFANEQVIAESAAEWGRPLTIDIDLRDKGAGKYTFYVSASNEAGDGPASDAISLWVGADTPEATSATLEYVNGNMEVSWNPVSASINGGFINLDNINYTVRRADGNILCRDKICRRPGY